MYTISQKLFLSNTCGYQTNFVLWGQEYCSVPNISAGPNKPAGGKILEKK